MKSIAITKPDMATLGQNPNGLSCFGLLSELFIKELSARTRNGIGAYRPLSLFYLEDEEEEETPSAPPEITLNFDLKVVLDAIRRQNEADAKRQEKKEKPSAQEKPEKKSKQPLERIIERVIIRERELKISTEHTNRLILQSPQRRWEIGPMSLRPAPLVRHVPQGASGASFVRNVSQNADGASATPPAFSRDGASSASRPTLPISLLYNVTQGADGASGASRPTLPVS